MMSASWLFIYHINATGGFFFQAEDGIRDYKVTGVQTCALPILAFSREGSGRVALSFIGEGGSSLGEWHEAINLCAARRLPAVFCIENNQTALSTPLVDQSAVRTFAD